MPPNSSYDALKGRIEGYLAHIGSPLVGNADAFIEAGAVNGIDPRYLVGIMFAESTLNKVPSRDCMGWLDGEENKHCIESLNRSAKGLANMEVYQGKDWDSKLQIYNTGRPDGNPVYSKTVMDVVNKLGGI